MMQDPNLYISIDIETDGDSLYENSMLNLGAVAFLPDRKEVGSFSINLKPREGAKQKKDTMEWWLTKNKEVYDEITKNQQDITLGLTMFKNWLIKMKESNSITGKIIFLCYPTGFDGAFLSAYWMKAFNGIGLNSVGFAFDFLDIKSYVSGKFNCTYADSGKKARDFTPDPKLFPHTHKGEDDARKLRHFMVNVRDAIIS